MIQNNENSLKLIEKLSPLEFKVYYYIKEHKIKNNRILAKILNTTPNTINVIKYRLVKKGVLTRDEVRERKYTKKKSEKETPIQENKEKLTKKKEKITLKDILGI